ncbi:MAG: hypothetical protein MUC48_11155 [Leptolyngbya sp. Prado105]|jgi:hypothetical protein|nr:hypothetical protein [Leptolyngbya sp. Prado105]
MRLAVLRRSRVYLSLACIPINLLIWNSWDTIDFALWQNWRVPTDEERFHWWLITQVSPLTFVMLSFAGIGLAAWSAMTERVFQNRWWLALGSGLSNGAIFLTGLAIVLFKYIIH